MAITFNPTLPYSFTGDNYQSVHINGIDPDTYRIFVDLTENNTGYRYTITAMAVFINKDGQEDATSSTQMIMTNRTVEDRTSTLKLGFITIPKGATNIDLYISIGNEGASCTISDIQLERVINMKYSRVPVNTFKQLGVNAANILADFDPTDGSYEEEDLVGATTGGISFQAQNEYIDWGEDIDNCPKNTKELMRFDNVTVTTSGTFVAMNADIAERLTALSDATTTNGVSKITPRTEVKATDFKDLWIVGDYSDVNTSSTTGVVTTAGFIAIHLKNTLSTGGFQLQTADKAKMQFAFEFTAHFSLDAQDEVPYEIYIRPGVGAA